MTSKVYKKPLVIIVVMGLLLVCTKAITQFGIPDGNKVEEVDNLSDTLEFGKPTGEDPAAEMERISKWYNPAHTTVFNGFFRLYDEKDARPKLIEEKQFQFSLDSNRNCNYEVGGIEVINNNRYSLTVDNNNKFVFLTKSSPGQGKEAQFFDIAAFEKILKETGAEAEVTKLGEDKILTVKNIKDPTVHGYAIYYSPVDYRIKKIVLVMWQLAPLTDIASNSRNDNDYAKDQLEDARNSKETETPGHHYKLEISYSGIDSSMNIKARGQDKYVHITNNRAELTEEYSGYEFINQLDKANN